MARPQKIGLDYFPVDVHMINDIKIQRLMHHKGGGKALVVYLFLLTRIYAVGHYLSWDEDMCFVLAKDLEFDENYIQDVVKYSVEVGLFSKEFFEEDRVLTSRGIQKQYIIASARRKIDYKTLPYFYQDLIDSEKLMSTETELLQTETELLHTETELLHTESTQNKIKKRKINKSTISPAHTREDGAAAIAGSTLSPVEQFRAENKGPVSTPEGINLIMSDSEYLLRLQGAFGMSVADIVGWIQKFSLTMKQVHPNMDDLCKHIEGTLRKKAIAGETSPRKEIISTQKQAEKAWLRISAIASLRKPEHADTLAELSVFNYANEKVQLMAKSTEEAEAAKALRPLLQECAAEITSSKLEFSFGINNKQNKK